MTFYNHIESLRGIAIDLTNGRKWCGASDKAAVFDALDAARREYMSLSDENAKLREEFDKMDVWHSKELTAVMAENAKLRELSSIMLKCIMANERKKLICWECPMHKQFDELRSYCCLEHEAKKLGVEVDG